MVLALHLTRWSSYSINTLELIQILIIWLTLSSYVQDTLADTSLAKSELGYQAKWNIEDGIRALITKSHDKETYELR